MGSGKLVRDKQKVINLSRKDVADNEIDADRYDAIDQSAPEFDQMLQERSLGLVDVTVAIKHSHVSAQATGAA